MNSFLELEKVHFFEVNMHDKPHLFNVTGMDTHKKKWGYNNKSDSVSTYKLIFDKNSDILKHQKPPIGNIAKRHQINAPRCLLKAPNCVNKCCTMLKLVFEQQLLDLFRSKKLFSQKKTSKKVLRDKKKVHVPNQRRR